MNRVWYIAGGAILAGVLAFLVYFWWAQPLLDGSRLDRFAYGPQGVNMREFAVLPRAKNAQLMDRVIALRNPSRCVPPSRVLTEFTYE